jgi:hypothetical protein
MTIPTKLFAPALARLGEEEETNQSPTHNQQGQIQSGKDISLEDSVLNSVVNTVRELTPDEEEIPEEGIPTLPAITILPSSQLAAKRDTNGHFKMVFATSAIRQIGSAMNSVITDLESPDMSNNRRLKTDTSLRMHDAEHADPITDDVTPQLRRERECFDKKVAEYGRNGIPHGMSKPVKPGLNRSHRDYRRNSLREYPLSPIRRPVNSPYTGGGGFHYDRTSASSTIGYDRRRSNNESISDRRQGDENVNWERSYRYSR